MSEEQNTNSRPCCIWLQDQGGLLVRAGCVPAEVPSELSEALEGCPECQAALAGAARLRDQLEAWREPEPAADLVERSLAAIALKAAMSSEAPAAEPGGVVLPFPQKPAALDPAVLDPAVLDPAVLDPAVLDSAAGLPSPVAAPARRRTTVIELLVTPPLAGPVAAAPPSGRSLAVRFMVQAAAAVVLFGVSSLFVAVYYPAVSYALAERDQTKCQSHLRRLQAAATRYRVEHPQGPALVGFELRGELIRGGYADELDFVCPSERGHELGVRSYVGDLPAGVASTSSGSALGARPLFWDRFGNHSSGFNVIRVDGRVNSISEDGLTRWRFRSTREDD